MGHFGKVAAIGVGIAGAAVAAFGALAVHEFSESEDAAAQLGAVLKSTGGVAGVTADQAKKLASSLQRVTKFSDEAILGGENLLLTFTNIGQDIFPEATNVMLDMSQALGQDVKSSAIQLGKALQDPILGVTALRRVGVNFNEAQSDVIKKLVETGHAAEAQKLILKELQTEFGGSAKAAGQTLGGQLEILKNKFSDVMEVFGGGLALVIKPLLDSFNTWFDSMGGAEGIFASMGNALKGLMENLKVGWDYIQPALMQLWTVLKEQLGPALKELWVALQPLAPYLGGALIITILTLIGALTILAMALTVVVKALTAIANALSWVIDRAYDFGYRLGTIFAGIIKWFLFAYINHKSFVDGVINNMYQLLGTIGAIGGAILNAILFPWVTAFKIIIAGINAVKSAMGGVGGFVGGAIGARASGGPVSGNTPYIVGEKGPELFVPSSAGNIVPNDKMGMSSSSNTTININVGLMTGSAVERRDAAAKMFEDLKDIASAKGQTVSQMIGAA